MPPRGASGTVSLPSPLFFSGWLSSLLSSLLPIDVAGCFLFGRSCWSTGFSPMSSRAHLGVAYVAVLWRRHVALQPLCCYPPFLAPALVRRAFRVSGIAPSRLSGRAFHSCSPRLLRVGSCPVPSHHHAQETRRKRDVSRAARAVHSAPRPAGVGHDRADSAGGSRARPQVRF